MSFAKAMFGFHRWYLERTLGRNVLATKITIEVGDAETAASILHSLSNELEMLQMSQPTTPLVELNIPFRFVGFDVEFKLRPAAPK